jgi:hypothetical protein
MHIYVFIYHMHVIYIYMFEIVCTHIGGKFVLNQWQEMNVVILDES